MPAPGTRSRIDPVEAIIAASRSATSYPPIPLTATSYDIHIDSGLAVVTTRRVFRNVEARSIEPTMTFPVPLDAVLYDIEVHTGGRVLKAAAQRKEDARAGYETAIDDGLTAVLHEEVLRGIHMLSIAHLPPNAEIEIHSTWATPLSFSENVARLRIPVTAGDVYGVSPLPDSDDLIGGGTALQADITIRAATGRVNLMGAELIEGRASVTLNAPIDIEVSDLALAPLIGRAADGRQVTLTVQPQQAGDAPLNIALLVDRSSSMDECCDGARDGVTKHAVVVKALKDVSRELRAKDLIDLWEFNNTPSRIGASRQSAPLMLGAIAPGWSRGYAFRALVERLRAPEGGTEIGAALEQAIGYSSTRDVLLITDGKSYALNVQRIARLGRRIAVVLVGEDSLEANIGHLATLTGGTVLAAFGTDIASTVKAAVASLRSSPLPTVPIEGLPRALTAFRGNAIISAEWGVSAGGQLDHPLGRAVVSVATTLAIARMDDALAADLATREGLGTHLTSLLLVDAEAKIQNTTPATRKIPLSSPRTAAFACMAIEACPEHRVASPPGVLDRLASRASVGSAHAALGSVFDAPSAWDIDGIDWDRAPDQLLVGDLSSLDPDTAEDVRQFAAEARTLDTADRLAIPPIVLAIGLIAHLHRHESRTAARIARFILGDPLPRLVSDAFPEIAHVDIE